MPWIAMDDLGSKPDFLFVHSTGPTHVHRRDTETKTEIRRHVMRDIGAARRVPRRNPRIDDLSTIHHTLAAACDNNDGEPGTQLQPPPIMRPFWDQDPLDILDQQWPMDVFSAYGIALLSTGSFLFPFAFTSSAFLRHFSSLYYAGPRGVLQAVHHQSSARARIMAMERSLGTISCIEGALANPDPDLAAGDNVIRAVLAVICFNLLNSDHDQARVHMQGMKVLIASRGGMQSLQGNSELVLMVFWVDVMASLLFNVTPNYPIPRDLVPTITSLPAASFPSDPMSRIISSRKEALNPGQEACLSSCMRDLAQVAHCIESQLAVRGNAVWDDEMFLGLRLNPIAHSLFGRWAQEATESGDQTLEMIRLGGILWVIWVKRRSRSYPASPIKYLSDLCCCLLPRSQRAELMSNNSYSDDDNDDALSVTLWLAVICGISSPPASSERTIALQVIADTLQRFGIKDWEDAKVRLRQMPWISAFDESCVEMWKLLD